MKRAKEAWAGLVRCKSSGGMGRLSAVSGRRSAVGRRTAGFGGRREPRPPGGGAERNAPHRGAATTATPM